MIDLSREKLITLSEAAKLFPSRSGKPIHIATIYAYTGRGKRGVVLESIQAGDIRCTTREAVGRFFTELTRRKRLRPVQADAGAEEAKAAGERLRNTVFRRRTHKSTE